MNNVTAQEMVDAAQLLLMTVNAYIGFDKSGLEVAGAAHIVLNNAFQDLQKSHEETTGISEGAGEVAASTQPQPIQGTGDEGRISAGTQGSINADETTPQADSPTQRNSSIKKRPRK